MMLLLFPTPLQQSLTEGKVLYTVVGHFRGDYILGHAFKSKVSITLIVHKLKMIFSLGAIMNFNSWSSLCILSLSQLDVITAI